jgi:hypothetical protein
MKLLYEETLGAFAKNAAVEFRAPAFHGAPPEESRTLSLRGERVRVTTSDGDVTQCKFLGEVKAYPPFVGPKDAEHTIRNEAADLGADVVRLSSGIGEATGKAYDCGGKYTK